MARIDECKEFFAYTYEGPNRNGSLCTKTSGSSVIVSVTMNEVPNLTSWNSYKYDWVMELQRYENGRWNRIGMREGYLSANSPSNREFTNVARKGKPMRVKIVFQYPITDGFTSTYWVND